MTSLGTFKRGQVVWAIWTYLSQHNDTDPRHREVPKSFTTRARKLIDLGVPVDAEDKPGLSGTDNLFTPEQAFELAVAIILQDTGLKQAEVAFFIRNIRGRLVDRYRLIMACPPAGRNAIDARDRPNSPTRADDKNIADTSVFMTFRYVEIREAWGRDAGVKMFDVEDRPVFLDVRFHRGVQQVASEMQRRADSIRDPVRIVIELSHVAVAVTEHLFHAPEMSRGRPPKGFKTGI